MPNASSIPNLDLSCNECAYDLRGLPHLLCPECGTLYKPRLRQLGLPAWLAALPASFTVLIALRVLSECMMVPSYHARWLTVGECGTGFTDPQGVLMFDLPFLLGLSGLCWWLAAYAPYVGKVARCAFTTAAGAWLITFAAFEILT